MPILLLVMACARHSPCEAGGGVCMASTESCPADARFTGFDPACEPLSRCCTPIAAKPKAPPVDAGPPPVDAGPPPVKASGEKCFIDKGECLPRCTDAHSNDGFVNDPCPAGEVCCVPR